MVDNESCNSMLGVSSLHLVLNFPWLPIAGTLDGGDSGQLTLQMAHTLEIDRVLYNVVDCIS